MKSPWLPTFPLHAANWLADPRVQMLNPAARCELLEALLRSWMLGKAVPASPDIAEAYTELWPEYEVVLHEHTALRQKRSELGKQGNEKRWGGRNSDPLAIARRSPGDRTRVHRTPTPTPTPTPTRTKTQTKPEKLFSPAAPADGPDPEATVDPPKKSRPTWITRYAEAWRDRTGGEMPLEPSFRPLAKLRAEHGDDIVLPAWLRYLEENEVVYLSAASFAAKFGRWSGEARPATQPRKLHRNDEAELEYLRRRRQGGGGNDPFLP